MSTLREIYFDSLKRLEDKNREIEIRMLLAYVNQIESMSDLYLKMDEEIKDLKQFENLYKRYLSGEPIGYLTNQGYFCGDIFYVDKSVLIPRMETEELIQYVVKKTQEIYSEQPINLVDVCTGSGCIGIELAKQIKINHLFLSDISEPALKIAKRNVENLIPNQQVSILCGDSLDPLLNDLESTDVVVANPPYILSKKEIDDSVFKYEPHLALLTTEKIEVYSSILKTISETNNRVKLIAFELGDEIKDLLEKEIQKLLPHARYEFIKDINGKWRICGIIL